MSPFRPTNINKKAYPGNASVIGPTKNATISCSSTNCDICSSTVCGAQSAEIFTLGCRCTTTTCPYCLCRCCCTCTVCNRTVPSGMWNVSEQYEARKRDAWGDSSCSNTPSVGYCTPCCGVLCSVANDCKGFYICCGPSTNKWFVAPTSAEVTRGWYERADTVTVANSTLGSCGWFVPEINQLSNPGFSCRTYWDTYNNANYWTNTRRFGSFAWSFCMQNGAPTAINNPCGSHNSNGLFVRSFRCTAT